MPRPAKIGRNSTLKSQTDRMSPRSSNSRSRTWSGRPSPSPLSRSSSVWPSSAMWGNQSRRERRTSTQFPRSSRASASSSPAFSCKCTWMSSSLKAWTWWSMPWTTHGSSHHQEAPSLSACCRCYPQCWSSLSATGSSWLLQASSTLPRTSPRSWSSLRSTINSQTSAKRR